MPLFILITSKISANNNNLNLITNLKRVVLYYEHLLNFNINIDLIPSDNKDSQNVATDAAIVPAFLNK